MKEFESYKKFVETTTLRDIKWEKRYGGVNQQAISLRDLRDNVEAISREEYNNKLEEIIKELKDLKE
jgi:hypothetical protein